MSPLNLNKYKIETPLKMQFKALILNVGKHSGFNLDLFFPLLQRNLEYFPNAYFNVWGPQRIFSGVHENVQSGINMAFQGTPAPLVWINNK